MKRKSGTSLSGERGKRSDEKCGMRSESGEAAGRTEIEKHGTARGKSAERGVMSGEWGVRGMRSEEC